jgi:hypothetical protein
MDVAKNIKLDVFTNCSWIPGEKYLNRLRQFKKIVLSLSVDGVGAVNDYIRHPSKWDIVDESVTAWLELEESSRNSVHIVWNPTINIYNIMSLGNMISWWFDKNNSINANWMAQTVEINSKASEHEVVPAGKFKFNVLQDPEYLSLSLLPASMKPTIINEINQHIDNLTAINKQLTQDILMPLIKIFDNTSVSLDLQKQLKKEFKKILADTEVDQHWFTQEIKVKFQKIIKNVSQVKQSQESLDKFLMYTRDLDQLRNESFSELFPDLAEQLNKSK